MQGRAPIIMLWKRLDCPSFPSLEEQKMCTAVLSFTENPSSSFCYDCQIEFSLVLIRILFKCIQVNN
ncbi:hypothetical protein scyTo_0000436 [Scyliorhinus torazame]|uniref:Uncharacterized protein n=1 Tax=Scyliorhinus torazame TaxID=75743 RepID=A0A401NXL2_SCYTO|nr:hypothetical protein [Scyliorhinus torazame]